MGEEKALSLSFIFLMKPESVENINNIYKHMNPLYVQSYSAINKCFTAVKRKLFILLHNYIFLITAYCPDANAIKAIYVIGNCAMNLS
jgi:hypothetical protein